MIKIFIQARSTSTRFPEKIFKRIDDLTVLEHVYYRCSSVCESVVLIPFGDVKVHNFCIQNRLPYFEGDLNDLVARHHEAAKAYLCDSIVRVTSDCPMIDQHMLDRMITGHQEDKNDFTSNWPYCVDGHDIDIFSMRLLEYLHKYSTEREHVGLDIKKDPKKKKFGVYKLCFVQMPYLKEWYPKLSIDTEEDFERVKSIYEKMKGEMNELSKITR